VGQCTAENSAIFESPFSEEDQYHLPAALSKVLQLLLLLLDSNHLLRFPAYTWLISLFKY